MGMLSQLGIVEAVTWTGAGYANRTHSCTLSLIAKACLAVSSPPLGRRGLTRQKMTPANQCQLTLHTIGWHVHHVQQTAGEHGGKHRRLQADMVFCLKAVPESFVKAFSILKLFLSSLAGVCRVLSVVAALIFMVKWRYTYYVKYTVS